MQKALAQFSGSLISPVCFSFGWVAYSFTTLASLVGNGRLMPETDFACKVINVKSGYARENRSWVLGRVVRDLEGLLDEEGLCVRIFEAQDGEARSATGAGREQMDVVFYASIGVMMVQCAIAAIPFAWDDYGIFMITVAGSVLALITGALPQWKVEKYACRADSKKVMAVTVGNGSRHITIIKGNGRSLDLEDLAAGHGPKVRRSWYMRAWFARTPSSSALGKLEMVTKPKKKPAMLKALPVDFWMTRLICTALALCWVALLITVSGLKAHAWFLLLVGALGMTQNAIVAAIGRKPETRGMHLREVADLRGHKVMDVLMDLECELPGAGKRMVEEFFPAELREDEKKWWVGERTEYDDKRRAERERRGLPAALKEASGNDSV